MIDIANELLLGKAREGFEGRGVYLIPKCVYELGGGSGPSYIDEIVSGVSPLTLTNALANGLNYVKAFGGCEQRNIPSQYTQVNYVTNTAQTRVDTGLKFDFSKNYEIEYRGRAVTDSWYVLQARDSSSSNISGISGSNGNGNIILAFNGGQTATTSLTRGVLRADHIWYIKGTINNGNLTLYVKDETTNEEETVTGTYSVSTPALSAKIGLLGNFAESTTPQLVGINNDVYMARIKEDGVTIMNYIPARQLATAGFYDTISGTFKTAETPENLVADGNTVPTPDNPMDIWCNNGVLKAKHKSGLPLGYTQVEYLESSGGQYLDTGVILKGETLEVDCTFCFPQVPPQNSTPYVVWGFMGAGTFPRAGVFVFQQRFACGSNATVYLLNADTNTHRTIFSASADGSTSTMLFDAETFSLTGSQGGYASNTLPFYLFGRNNYDGGAGNFSAVRIYSGTKFKLNDVLVRDYITCRRLSDNELGMYDFVSGQFFTNQGTGSFSAGDPVSDPIEIYTDGTTETIGVINIIDDNYTELEYIESSGTQYIDTGYALTTDNFEISGTGIKRSNNGIFFGARNTTSPYVGVLESRTSSGLISYWTGVAWAYFVASTNEKYDFKITCSTDFSCKVSCSGFVDKTFTAVQTYVNGENINLFGNNPFSSVNGSVVLYAFSIKDNGVLVRNFVPVKRNSDGEIGMYDTVNGTFYANAGSGTFISGPVVYRGGTATCENLLSVADYTDVQEVLSGNITRKVGIKVLDGTESWNYYSVTQGALFRIQIADSVSGAKNDLRVLCNGYQVVGTQLRTSGTLSGSATNYDFINDDYTTLDTWKTYLTNQYNAGTPVIIVYPLATETTESVTAQTLTTEEGDNTITITQASISGLTMEASYKKKV